MCLLFWGGGGGGGGGGKLYPSQQLFLFVFVLCMGTRPRSKVGIAYTNIQDGEVFYFCHPVYVRTPGRERRGAEGGRGGGGGGGREGRGEGGRGEGREVGERGGR